jgi:hypothetical protein
LVYLSLEADLVVSLAEFACSNTIFAINLVAQKQTPREELPARGAVNLFMETTQG